ncbi:MAG: acyltransferase family protein [Caulobacteraceae bacterium]
MSDTADGNAPTLPSAAPATLAKRTYGDIQGLRALAAALVVLSHGLILLHPGADRAFAGYLGEMGVCVFFVISGFIMVVSTQGEGGAGGADRFIRKRVFRIVPIYWISTALLAVINFRNSGPAGFNTPKLLLSLIFIPTPEGPLGPVRPYHNQGWTLELEMLFYLIFALALLAPTSRKSWAVLAGIAMVVAAGCFLRSPFDMAYPPTLATFFSDPVLLLFGAGVIIAKFRLRGDARRARSPLPLVAVLVAVTAAAFGRLGGGFPFPMASVVLAWALAIASVWLCSTAHVDAKDSYVSRLLDRCGDASYSVYMFHIFFVSLLATLWRRLLGEAYTPVFLAAAVIVAFAAAGLIYRTLEAPIGAYLRRFVAPKLART